jgi:hypothetical protein
MSDFITTLLTEAQKITGWTEGEVRAFVQCIRADTPDALADAIPSALAWARGIETSESMISLMKTLPVGALHARWNGQEIELRINPDASVSHDADGTIRIDWSEARDD